MSFFATAKSKLISSTSGLQKSAQRSLNGLGVGIGNASSLEVNQAKEYLDTPWGTEGVPDSFFEPIKIKAANWNKLFPYRLVVVQPSGNSGKYEIVGDFSSAASGGVTISKNGGSFRLAYEPISSSWEYRLPITPQQLSISTPYAISNEATLRGVIEEHNGVKYKMINMAGSFGVWPYRPSLAKPPSQPNSLGFLLSGTIEAATGAANQLGRVIRSATSNHPAAKPEIITAEEEQEAGLAGTGYAHALLLESFLEQYSEQKKRYENRNWRLALDMPKQNQTYLVTPLNFTYAQSIDSPNEFKFQLQLKAFKRIELNKSVAPTSLNLPALDASALQRAITTITEARKALGSALNVVKAVRSDFLKPFEALRQTSLFIKDLAGFPLAVADVVKNFDQNYKSLIAQSIQNNRDAQALIKKTSKTALGASLNITSTNLFDSTDISGRTVSDTNPINKIFDNPEANFELFNSIEINDLQLTPAQQDAIDNEVESAQLITIDDLKENRNTLLELSTQISNSYGAGDATYAFLYGKPAPYVRTQEMTIDEFALLNILYQTVEAIDSLTATQDLDDGRIDSALDFTRNLALESNITFENSPSKVRVPVPFGLNIEQIAARYLQNPDRWLEIATLNALKSPYIDETGFFRSLLSNADGRQINIANIENLVVGQKITLSSVGVPPTTRTILNIEQISETNYLLTLDGADDLDIYTTNDQAKIRAYLPGTVNSQTFIYIPSEVPATDDIRTAPVKGLVADPLSGLSRVDWLVTESGDLALDAYGDFRLAVGMTNLIQALKLKFAVAPGKILKHPEYGGQIKYGDSIADFDITTVLDSIRTSIKNDSRFSDIEKLEIFVNGPTATVNLSVSIANGNGVLPISFNTRI